MTTVFPLEFLGNIGNHWQPAPLKALIINNTFFMVEKRIEERLKTGVNAMGGLCLKFVTPGMRGAPDRIILWRGTTRFVETKTLHGQVSPLQRSYHTRLRAQGFDVAVLWTIEQVDRYVINLKYGIQTA